MELNPVWAIDLQSQRDIFWDTQPAYGGSKEIWDALKAACAADDPDTTKLILDAAGVIVNKSDMTVCYDERGECCLANSIRAGDTLPAPSPHHHGVCFGHESCVCMHHPPQCALFPPRTQHARIFACTCFFSVLCGTCITVMPCLNAN